MTEQAEPLLDTDVTEPAVVSTGSDLSESEDSNEIPDAIVDSDKYGSDSDDTMLCSRSNSTCNNSTKSSESSILEIESQSVDPDTDYRHNNNGVNTEGVSHRPTQDKDDSDLNLSSSNAASLSMTTSGTSAFVQPTTSVSQSHQSTPKISAKREVQRTVVGNSMDRGESCPAFKHHSTANISAAMPHVFAHTSSVSMTPRSSTLASRENISAYPTSTQRSQSPSIAASHASLAVIYDFRTGTVHTPTASIQWHERGHTVSASATSNPPCNTSNTSQIWCGSNMTQQTEICLPICRICQCIGDKRDPLIEPCRCSGTIKHVHNSCLMRWLRVIRRRNRGPLRCELCGYQYNRHKRFKFRNWRWPRVSVRDRIHHGVFFANLFLMIGCAVATIMCFMSNTGGELSPRFPANKRSLSPEEAITLTCGILFFISFFVAMTVQIRAKHNVYQLFCKFIAQNTVWQIEPYDQRQDREILKRKRKTLFSAAGAGAASAPLSANTQQTLMSEETPVVI